MMIGNRRIGPGEPMYVIAEMSANHKQDLGTAIKMIEVAASFGADAVKLQTYTPDTITLDVSDGPFMIGDGSLWAGRSLYDLYEDAYTPWEWYPTLAEVAERCGLHLFSTPFDLTAVDFLLTQDVPAFKIASFELIDHALISAVAETGKPVIMSTGMATLTEIAEAVEVARHAGCRDLVLLRCNSGYPAPEDEMDLRTIPTMAEVFDCPVGLSDHTKGLEAAVVARSLGACVLEKHYVLDSHGDALDAEFSLRPTEFEALISAVRRAEAMLGTVRFGPTEREKHSMLHRRSLFVAEDLSAGDTITEANVRSVRPGDGLAPKYLSAVVGSKLARSAAKGTPLSWDLLLGGGNGTEG